MGKKKNYSVTEMGAVENIEFVAVIDLQFDTYGVLFSCVQLLSKQ